VYSCNSTIDEEKRALLDDMKHMAELNGEMNEIGTQTGAGAQATEEQDTRMQHYPEYQDLKQEVVIVKEGELRTTSSRSRLYENTKRTAELEPTFVPLPKELFKKHSNLAKKMEFDKVRSLDNHPALTVTSFSQASTNQKSEKRYSKTAGSRRTKNSQGRNHPRIWSTQDKRLL